MKLIQTVKRRFVGEDKDTKGPKSSKEKEAPVTNVKVTTLPQLSSVRPTEFQDLFVAKLAVCSVVYDFSRGDSQPGKEFKRATLLELVEFVHSTRNLFNEATVSKLVIMVSANIFRPLPYSNQDEMQDGDEPKMELAWPHLQLVYEFFLRFIVSSDMDPKVAKRYVDQRFISGLVEMFASEDPRERDYLKTILHRIYGKFMSLRSGIRKSIQNFFLKVIHESAPLGGVVELLEVLGSIINGFALPLKLEHVELLIKVLIPMHKVECLSVFYHSLLCCIACFCEKEPLLACDVVAWLLQHWPVGNVGKQVIFLDELEETLSAMEVQEFERIEDPLAYRLGLCISSPHFQVSERALCFWNNNQVTPLVMQSWDKLWPSVVSALFKNTKHHWNASVQSLTLKVMELYMEAAPELFDECVKMHTRKEEEEAEQQALRARNWSALQSMHDKANAAQKSAIKESV